MSNVIDLSQLRSGYEQDGYAVLPSLLGADHVATITQECSDLCRGRLGDFHGIEPGGEDLPESELLRRYLAIHHPHKLAPAMRSCMSDPKLVPILTALVGDNVKCMQSMLFMKGPGNPGQAWHQDEYYIPTRDRSLCGLWIALDDATIDNGCLWVIPGSHKSGVLWPQRAHNDPNFDFSGEAYGYPYKPSDAIAVEVPAGSVVLFNGYLLHRSLVNATSDRFRRALVYHYMRAESLLPWFSTASFSGITFGTLDVRDVVMVAGEDPYADKGYESLNAAFVRPSGSGT